MLLYGLKYYFNQLKQYNYQISKCLSKIDILKQNFN